MNALLIPVTTFATNTALTNVTAEISEVTTQMIAVMTSLVANPFFAFLFACGFVRILMSIVKKAKKTAR